jgi:putative membrane protein
MISFVDFLAPICVFLIFKLIDMKKEELVEDELIVRDYLARQRTTLANERTLLSYIRTSLYFLVSGTALLEVNVLAHVRDLGYVAFALSILLLILGFFNFYKIRKKLSKGYYRNM